MIYINGEIYYRNWENDMKNGKGLLCLDNQILKNK